MRGLCWQLSAPFLGSGLSLLECLVECGLFCTLLCFSASSCNDFESISTKSCSKRSGSTLRSPSSLVRSLRSSAIRWS